MAKIFEGPTEAEAAIAACEALGIARSQIHYRVISRNEEAEHRVVIEVDEAMASSDFTDTPEVDGQEFFDLPQVMDEPGATHHHPRPQSRHRSHETRRRIGADNSFQRNDDDEFREFRAMTAAQKEHTRKPALDEAVASERAQKALCVVRDILGLGHFQAEAQLSHDSNGEVQIDIHGEDEGLIIGRKGETLLALQFLTNRLVSHDIEGSERIMVDCEGYRERRHQALHALALKLGEKAKMEGKVVTVNPMNAHDRRIFHLALDGQNGLRTRSEGEGLYRRVLVIPENAEHHFPRRS